MFRSESYQQIKLSTDVVTLVYLFLIDCVYQGVINFASSSRHGCVSVLSHISSMTAAKKELYITPVPTCLFDESALLLIDFDECFILAAVHVGSSFSLSSRSFGRR